MCTKKYNTDINTNTGINRTQVTSRKQRIMYKATLYTSYKVCLALACRRRAIFNWETIIQLTGHQYLRCPRTYQIFSVKVHMKLQWREDKLTKNG